MSTTTAVRGPRQVIVLATVAGIHVAAWLAMASGLLPRPSALIPEHAPITLAPPEAVRHEIAAPTLPEALDFTPLLVQEPVVEYPAPAEPRAGADSPVESIRPGAGPSVPAAEYRSPVVRRAGSRLDDLIDRCYPPAARRRNEEGRVVVRVAIDAAGRAVAHSVERGSGFQRLDAAVQCVIRRPEFVPARRDGQAVESTVLLPIEFRLD